MAVYIKDRETSRLVGELAQRCGLSKTAAVRQAVAEKLEQTVSDDPNGKRPLRHLLAELRRAHPLPPATGLKADKAFFDELSGDL